MRFADAGNERGHELGAGAFVSSSIWSKADSCVGLGAWAGEKMPKSRYWLVTLVCLCASCALLNRRASPLGPLLELVGWTRVERGQQRVDEPRWERANEPKEFVWADKIHDWSVRRESGASFVIGDNLNANEAPRGDEAKCIWPEDSAHCQGDRIINQIKLRKNAEATMSVIEVALANDHSQAEGGQIFGGCSVDKCRISHNLYAADAIVFRDSDVAVLKKWPRLEERELRHRQIWIAHLLESPANTFDRRLVRPTRNGRHKFNWTAAYRSDADLVAPYAKFVPYHDTLDEFLALKRQGSFPLSDRRIGSTRATRNNSERGKVAWFVSNCYAHNNRLEFARELANYIQVDIFGKCGNLTCSKWSQDRCLEQLRRGYKFYLAFENSNSHEYITEKLYRNALGHNDAQHKLLPIVMGATRADYERLAPPHSFIHVDDFGSAQELASYLRELDADEAKYETYFRWKALGRFIDTKFWCRLCAMLHEWRVQARTKTYENLIDWWWRPDG